MPKMHSKKIDISALIKDQINREDIKAGEYSIQIEQPNQEFFYGRLLVGIEDISSNSYSGNHSYYDNSKNKESILDHLNLIEFFRILKTVKI